MITGALSLRLLSNFRLKDKGMFLRRRHPILLGLCAAVLLGVIGFVLIKLSAFGWVLLGCLTYLAIKSFEHVIAYERGAVRYEKRDRYVGGMAALDLSDVSEVGYIGSAIGFNAGISYLLGRAIIGLSDLEIFGDLSNLETFGALSYLDMFGPVALIVISPFLAVIPAGIGYAAGFILFTVLDVVYNMARLLYLGLRELLSKIASR